MTSLFDSLGLLVGSVVVLTIVYLVGRVIGGARLPWLGPVLAVAAVLGGPFWLSTAFDRFGVTERAVVVRRSESVRRTWNGGFERRFSLDLKYPRSDESFTVRVDQRHFDQVVFGDPVTVVALPIRKSFARPGSMSSREWLAVEMPWGVLVVLGTFAAFAAGKLDRASINTFLATYTAVGASRNIKWDANGEVAEYPTFIFKSDAKTLIKVGEVA